MARARALHEGDDVRAGAASIAELHHFDGSSTRLDAGATAGLERVVDPDGRPHVILRLGPGASFHRTAPLQGRRGQYEARTPAAAALARSATFVARCAEDGTSYFAAVAGTVVVRGAEGGMVVLRAGEAVGVAADGTVGEVALAPADDEWVAVNAHLDAEAVAAEAPAPEPEPEPEPEPQPGPEPRPDDEVEDDPPLFVPEPDDSPWKVGVAAAVAVTIGVFSVVIGRGGSARPITQAADPAFAVAGPPAYAGPPVSAPTTSVPVGDQQPTTATTAAPAPAARAVPPASYEVVGKTCHRGGGTVITYTGVLHNDSSTPGTFAVRVRFLGAKGTTVATATTTVKAAAQSTTTFRVSSGPLRNAKAAQSCDSEVVERLA